MGRKSLSSCGTWGRPKKNRFICGTGGLAWPGAKGLAIFPQLGPSSPANPARPGVWRPPCPNGPAPRGFFGIFWPKTRPCPPRARPTARRLAHFMGIFKGWPAPLWPQRRAKNSSAVFPLIWPPRHGRGPFHFQPDRIHSASFHLYSISWRVISVLQCFGHARKNTKDNFICGLAKKNFTTFF